MKIIQLVWIVWGCLIGEKNYHIFFHLKMELLQFFVVCFFKGGFIIYVNLKYGLEVFFHGQFLIKILFEWKSCHGYLLILCVSC